MPLSITPGPKCPQCGLPLSYCDQPTEDAPQLLCDGPNDNTCNAGCGYATEADANARAIAAVPEMLDLLRATVIFSDFTKGEVAGMNGDLNIARKMGALLNRLNEGV